MLTARQDISPINVTFCQPVMAKYRVPVFRTLESRPGVTIRVWHLIDPTLTSVEADGYEARVVPARTLTLRGRTLRWMPAMLAAAKDPWNHVLCLTWDVHFVSLLPAIWRARRNGIGTVVWGHGVSKHEAGWRRAMRERIARAADAVLFYNHSARQSYIDAGFAPEKLFVALNTIDLSAIETARAAASDDPAGTADFREQHNLGHGPVVLYVSRLDPDNRVDLLLQACATLLSKLPELRCVIIGKGADDARLRAMVEQLGLGEHVHMPGPVYDEEVLSRYFAAADVFCYPANIGLSLLHAFAYGIPVVTGDDRASHNPEIEAFEHDVNGLMFTHSDADALSRTLERVITDTPLHDRLAAAAHRTATQTFTLGNMVDGMEASFRYAANVARQRH